MATSYSYTQQGIHEGMAAQRWQASQASREQGELDERSVLYTIQVKLAEGRRADAEEIARQWRESRKGQPEGLPI